MLLLRLCTPSLACDEIYKTRHSVLLLQWKRSCNWKNIRYFYHLRKICINMFQGEELSSSEFRSYLTLYLLRIGSDAVADFIKDLADPTIVLSCIFLTSLHTWSRTFWKYLTIIKILKGWTSSFIASTWKYSVTSFTSDKAFLSSDLILLISSSASLRNSFFEKKNLTRVSGSSYCKTNLTFSSPTC